MDRKLKEIRGRYDAPERGVPDEQVLHDIHSLLGYIDQLHRRLVEQAAEDAVQAAFFSSSGRANPRVH